MKGGHDMKKALAILSVLTLVGAAAAADRPVEGKKWEFSTAFGFESYSYEGSMGAATILNFPVRLGYYLWKGLEFEPELKFTSYHYSGGGSESGALFSLNLAYNFKLKSPRLIPFVLGGYGFGDGYAHLLMFVEPLPDGVSATAYDFGGGIKYLFGNIAALRLEYRYTHWMSEKLGFSNDYNIHNIFVGISLFF